MTDRLLEHLRHHANPGGLVMVREDRLLKELSISPETLLTALSALESRGAIRILSPAPFLTLRLCSWSGSNHDHDHKEQQISSSEASLHREVPVSSSTAAAATQQEDGGAGEGEMLLADVLAVLGPEAEREEFRAILLGYDPALIRRCLRRVQATKAIRVSRAALFRSLLRKLSS